MSLLLHIDTAVDAASVCLSDGEEILALEQNKETRESAAWLQPAIRNLLRRTGVRLHHVAAVSVSAGPGSYTGLRVGMASAKGLCYVLDVPLIAVNTLQAMAGAALPQARSGHALLCPMIDARRMEVFTAVYNQQLEQQMAPTNLVVAENSFDTWLLSAPVDFFGNGSSKVQGLIRHDNARFIEVSANAASLVPLAWAFFRQQQFAPLAYAEPQYVKAFYAPHPAGQ